MDSSGLPFPSYAASVNFMATSLVARWRQPGKPLSIPPSARMGARINHVTASEQIATIMRNVEEQAAERQMLNQHLSGIARDFRDSWSPQAYERNNRQQWADMHAMLSPLAPRCKKLPCHLRQPFPSFLCRCKKAPLPSKAVLSRLFVQGARVRVRGLYAGALRGGATSDVD